MKPAVSINITKNEEEFITSVTLNDCTAEEAVKMSMTAVLDIVTEVSTRDGFLCPLSWRRAELSIKEVHDRYRKENIEKLEKQQQDRGLQPPDDFKQESNRLAKELANLLFRAGN